MKSYKLVFISIICSLNATAQTDFGTWLAYKNNAKLSDKFIWNNQVDHRSFEFDFENDQFFFASGFTYSLAPNISVGAGYRFLENKDVFVEHGMFQKLSIKSALNKLKITNKFMIEERWINNNSQLRFRIGVDLGIPLSNKLDLILFEEAHLMNQSTSFNQNRVGVKTNYKISSSFNLVTGIMHWQFNNFHRWVANFMLVHSLDLRKNKPQ